MVPTKCPQNARMEVNDFPRIVWIRIFYQKSTINIKYICLLFGNETVDMEILQDHKEEHSAITTPIEKLIFLIRAMSDIIYTPS